MTTKTPDLVVHYVASSWWVSKREFWHEEEATNMTVDQRMHRTEVFFTGADIPPAEEITRYALRLIEQKAPIPRDRVDPDNFGLDIYELPFPTLRSVLESPAVRSERNLNAAGFFALGDDGDDYRVMKVESQIEQDARVRIDWHVDRCPDGQRTTELCSLWFDHQAAAVFVRGGRSGMDVQQHWVVSRDVLVKLRIYVNDLLHAADGEAPLDLDEVRPFLSLFYSSLGQCTQARKEIL
jgi:hypothetical protein